MRILQETNDIVDSDDAEELLECKGHIEFRNGEEGVYTQRETQLNHTVTLSNSHVRRKQEQEVNQKATEGPRQCVLHS